jgi:hypothetical protein
MKKTTKVVLLTTGLIVLFIVGMPQGYVWYDNYSVRHQGEALTKSIDAFELKEGRVPATLEEIGQKSSRLSYYASGPHHYTISYMDWASARYVFDSKNHKWEFTPS